MVRRFPMVPASKEEYHYLVLDYETDTKNISYFSSLLVTFFID